ncbi:MAG: cation:proton antiporter [Verrucomicrobia bacterium]|nr:cation:proton antiporter [Verrucomicrobiota bacterium]
MLIWIGWGRQGEGFMHGVSFIQDLAVVMIVAGVVTVIFHRLRQPVILGYILAGFIIGPHTPPFPLVANTETIQTLADLGVVFLMFSLGLEFHLRKLQRVGMPAMLTAVFEVLCLLLIGHEIGALFGWTPMERIFLGCILAISSTAIIVTHLRESGLLKGDAGQFITGLLVMEDVAVILMMVLLPGLARTGELPTSEIALTMLQLILFLVGLIVVGLIVVPRLLKYVSRFNSDEMLLVTILALCFGTAMLAAKLEYSVALGAFIIGAIVAESRELGRVTRLMAPIRDLFMAVFFVAIGMMIKPSYLLDHLGPVLVITLLFVPGKMLACSLGAFLTGRDAKTSLVIGANMAQLGEFAFVLAALGQSLGSVGTFLYPVVAAVTVLSAVLRPHLIHRAPDLATWVTGRLPAPVVAWLTVYNRWVLQLGTHRRANPAMKFVRSLTFQIAITVCLIAAAFVAGAFLARYIVAHPQGLPHWLGGAPTVIWMGIVILLLPLYIAVVRKMQALAMLLSEIAVADRELEKRRAHPLRRLLSHTMFLLQLVLLGMITLLASAALLPPWQTLGVLLLIIILLVLGFGKVFNKWYSRGKFALLETLSEPPLTEEASEPPAPLPDLLRDAKLVTVILPQGTAVAGKLISELELRTRFGVSIVAIRRAQENLINPGPDDELREGDQVLLIGDDAHLAEASQCLRSGHRPSSGVVEGSLRL